MTDGSQASPVPREAPAFAHASEAEFARILDFYEVRWVYEPHTFPILWNLDGAVVESFSPDFYLPDLDLYVEMTTLRQKLVRKKNRKLRRLRELYPDIRIKLFYGRDFRMLMLKFGRLALVNELTGTTGQVVPDRSADARTDAGTPGAGTPVAPHAPDAAVRAGRPPSPPPLQPAPPGPSTRGDADADPDAGSSRSASRNARRRRRRAAARAAAAVPPTA